MRWREAREIHCLVCCIIVIVEFSIRLGRTGWRAGRLSSLAQSHREDKRLEVGLASTDHHAVQRAIANAQTKIAFQDDLGGRELRETEIGGNVL